MIIEFSLTKIRCISVLVREIWLHLKMLAPMLAPREPAFLLSHIMETSRFICTYLGCEKSYTTKKILDRHVRISHKGKMLNQRTTPCGKTFPTGDFKRHVTTCKKCKRSLNLVESDESARPEPALVKKPRFKAVSIQTEVITANSIIEEISTDARQSHGTDQATYEPATI